MQHMTDCPSCDWFENCTTTWISDHHNCPIKDSTEVFVWSYCKSLPEEEMVWIAPVNHIVLSQMASSQFYEVTLITVHCQMFIKFLIYASSYYLGQHSGKMERIVWVVSRQCGQLVRAIITLKYRRFSQQTHLGSFPPECLMFKGNSTSPPVKLKVLTISWITQ